MAAGIDSAGLALAIFPIVINAVDWYGGRVKSSDIRLLAQSLRNQQQIFVDSVEYLLRGIVSAAELQELLDDVGGASWTEKQLNVQVVDNLGSQADLILETIKDIHHTISKLNKKLPDPGDAAKEPGLRDRAKLISKAFLHGKLYTVSLERLRARVGEFRKLTKGALKLASSRGRLPADLRHLGLVQECASGLYRAVRNGFPCECEQLHPANIKLDVWCKREEANEKVQLEFSLLFANDAEIAHSNHWMTAEIKAPALEKTDSNQVQATDLQPPPGSSTVPKSISLSVSCPTPGATQDNQDKDDLINDICALLNRGDPPPKERPPPERVSRGRPRLGSISDNDGRSYQLRKQEHPPASPVRSSRTLTELLNQRSSLSRKSRVQLASTLAWGVLQISSTNWLSGTWTKDNILVVMNAANEPLPYVSHRLPSSRRASTDEPTLDPPTTNAVADWVRNASLFALGVFLIEMAYSGSIEDLAVKQEKEAPVALTTLLTAQRMCHIVHEELGWHYAQAVNACIFPQGVELAHEGKPADASQFGKWMMKNIIDPLNVVVASFTKPNVALGETL